ncbi:acetyl-CoA synthetase-like protein [Coniophora puteana RWD-64-598 SS2]|uniref:Acetyl-CoA synthetase-like protein n=1 Tax=Coniophora puteana (strain RWD-64-598) TaxID=741705 RepID=A0A5M3MMR5_CONPW|nr:acetyl-CoA synthetase-like protein [Coniophora puteana RWD-64-598 SS2]EIW79995.1 acetyl-CoA synthetase-like protein [Coniophora puteana RWD-64-598 SS2]
MLSTKLLPPHPKTQALDSDTFHVPPLDASLTLAEVVEWNAAHSPSHPLFKFPLAIGGVRTIFWAEANAAVLNGSKILQHRIHTTGRNPRPVVGILAISDVIPYAMNLLSCLRCNFVPFPISPRNSPLAVAHLVERAQIEYVLVGREKSMQDLIQHALDITRSKYPQVTPPEVLPMLQFDEVYSPSEATVNLPDVTPYVGAGPDADTLVLHSSGSTSFPKHIPWTNYRFTMLQLIPFFGGRDLTGEIFSLHTMPMYHGMGVLQICWAAACGLVISAFEPVFPSTLPTPDNLYVAANGTDSNVIFCVPSIIEQWASNPEYVKWLASRSGVLFGGGPLNKEIGDYLTSQGVSIFILYGLTEVGIISPILPATVDYDWDYFTFPKLITPDFVPYGNNSFELLIVPNEFSEPHVLNTKSNGIQAYATSDLITPHPTRPGLWKVFGRTDDQIMHSTGEKTNPGPLENMLNQDKHVLSSVMFGRGKFQAGVLIDPAPNSRFDPVDEVKLAEFRNLIWPTVEAMNAYAPQHSRIFKEMIIVASPSKPFTYTAKNTARRQAIIDTYEEEIEKAYSSAHESTQSGISPPSEWSQAQTLSFVRKIVYSALGQEIPDDVDLFQHGCDSLQATWIRNSILRALRDSSDIDTRSVKENMVYMNTSISALATFVVKFVCGQGTEDNIDLRQRALLMQSLVDKHLSEALPVHQPRSSSQPDGMVVLVTGTTGTFGSQTLVSLIQDPAVTRVYALNRASSSGQAIEVRQTQAFEEWELDTALLKAEKLQLLEGNVLAENFGVGEATYQEITKNVTHIVHNAWIVNFNLQVDAFGENLRSVRRLVDFSLSSPLATPPKFVFTSSIGVLQNVQGKTAVPEAHVGAEVAAGSGYAESKWITEQILQRVSAQVPSFNSLIVRVGQLCGGANTGSWNTKEWFPALVQSVKATGCFPTEEKSVSWIPTSVAAFLLVKLTGSTYRPRSGIVHLIHPHPVQFSSLAAPFSSALNVPMVSYKEWLSKLEALNGEARDADVSDLRALRLLTFFQGLALDKTAGDAMGFAKLDCTQLKASSVLADAECEPLGADNVRRWLDYWRRKGLMSR